MDQLMMTNQFDTEELKLIIVSKLKALSPTKIILFGSYAYGVPSVDSDLDICVIKKELKSKAIEKKEIRNLLKDILIAKDILVSSEKEFDFYSQQIGSVYMDINKKGVVLWPSS